MSKKISAALLFGFPVFAFLAGAPAVSYAAPQETFTSPEQAGAALIDANKNSKEDELLNILGPEAADLIHSGDPAADQKAREKFSAAYDAGHTWESAAGDKGTMREILLVGADKWPLPIPLVNENGKWRFDTKTGRQEILDRRIGHNELDVINVCRAYVEAQADYFRVYPGRHEYAQKLKSTSGKHDGLYWPVAKGTDKDEEQSPLGALMASAEAEGYSASEAHVPYHGYYYKILKEQTAAAHGGAKDYVAGDHMTRGFALLAYPAKYGDSGIKTFIVNQAGIVHEKDLGPDTAAAAAKIEAYDPDESWRIP